jgi:hypothetical protein
VQQPKKKSIWKDAVPALGVGAASFFMLAFLQFQPVYDAEVFVLFSPFSTEQGRYQAVLDAGGQLVSRSPVSFAFIARSHEPGFFESLRTKGAWLILDASGRGLCKI